MEKSFEFGYHQQTYQISPNNLSLFHSIDKPFGEIPHLVEESTFMFPFSGSQQLNTNNLHNRLFNNTLHFHDPFPLIFSPAPIEDFPAFDLERQIIPRASPTPPGKNFFIYDQSRDKSTMIYNSKVQIGTSLMPRNPPNTCNLSKEEGLIRVSGDSNTYYPPLRHSMDNNCVSAEEDEMHEDTEDLNALLSSDDEYDDDEETSTGHSPSTVIDNRFWEPAEEIGEEEVNSFASRPTTKRRRTHHTLGDDDAESVYVDFASRYHKRFRREKIDELLRALRGLIPDAEGKDAVVVIDEAVNYLRSLKVKAKALGLIAL